MDYNSQKEAYTKFIIDEAYNQHKMAVYVEEAVLWTQGSMTYDKLYSLNEGIKETIKEKFQSAWKKIKAFVRKIIDGIKNLAMSRQKFLETNKDVILKRQVKYQEDFELYPYDEGINRIGKLRVREYDYAAVTGKSGGKALDPEDFTNTVIHGYFGIQNMESDEEDFLDNLKDYFRGGGDTVTYSNKQINMANMYDFCVNYKTKILDVLDSDQTKIENSYNKAINNLSSIKMKPQNASYLFDDEDEPIYSFFFEDYVCIDEAIPNTFTKLIDKAKDKAKNINQKREVKKNLKNPPNPNNPSNDNDTESTTDSTDNKAQRSAAQHIKDGRMDNSKTKHADTGEMEKDVNNDKEKYEKIEKAIRCWAGAANDIMSAKSAICEEIYKTYLGIIEKHVKSYLGQSKDDNTGKTAQRTVTDYNNDELNDKAKAALQNQKGITNVQLRYTNNQYNAKESNKYALKIDITNDDGSTRTVYQSVERSYKADRNLQYKEGSIKVRKDKNGLWKISRRYIENGQETKDRFLYIDHTKNFYDNSTDVGYDDGKVVPVQS